MKRRITVCLLSAIAILAISSACTAPPAPEEPKTQTLDTGIFRFEHDGITTRYAVYGSGPICMVVSNSWGITIEGLRAVYRYLEPHLTMVYFDPRGMGGSSEVRQETDKSMAAVRADLEALYNHLKLGKVAVIGWSNGAMNLMLYAADHADQISAAVIVSGTPYNNPDDTQAIMAKYPDLFKEYGALIQQLSDPQMSAEEQNGIFKTFLMEKYFPVLFADPEAGKTKIAEMWNNVPFSWAHMIYSMQVDSPKFDAREGLSKITCPTLVIAGAHDLLPPERVKEAADAIPGSQFVVFENSGHLSMIEETKKFVSTVSDFIVAHSVVQ